MILSEVLRYAAGRHQNVRARLASRWRRVRWLMHLRSQGVFIDSSVEITGRQDFAGWITAAVGCWVERDCGLWVAEEPESNPRIDLGKVYIGRNCYIGAYAPVSIDDDSLIGAYSYIISAGHRMSDRALPVREQGYYAAPVQIGKDVWIGCHVVVLPGVGIADHAVVGAGAVVTKSIAAGEIWAGVPARKIGER